MGPVKIKIIGFDKNTNKLYFARTDWAECDCETDLYVYDLANDSLKIILKWASRYDFSTNPTKVIESKGLVGLIKIPPIKQSDTIFTFSWLPKIPYYDRVTQKQTKNCPFNISVGNKNYKYIQCYSQNEKPIVRLFSFTKNWGVLVVNYQGDCYEGNKKDEIIFYKRSANKIISIELKPNDHLSGEEL